MSKNLIVILYFGLAAVGLILIALVAIFAPDQLETIATQVGIVLGLASTAAISIYLLGKQASTLEEVKTQTNGNLTVLRQQLAAKDAELADAQRQLLQVVSASPPAQGL